MRSVVFGSLNNPMKLNEEVIALWAQVLARVDDAHLVLFVSERQARFAELFERHGIDRARLRFVARQSPQDYLRLHQGIDIMLDPFPYNGHMTSCDALWMGVPVVTLRGRTSVGRGGVSLLAALGLPQLIAQTPQEYVEIARSLASDRDWRSELRAGLRQRMRNSVLCDLPGYVRAVEEQYLNIWRRWCGC